jgi:hypothetical protein
VTNPYVQGEPINAGKMYDRIESRLDALEANSGWVNLTLLAGAGTAKYRQIGAMVEVRFNATGQSIPSGSTGTIVVAVGGLPPAAQPTDTIYGVANLGGSTAGQVVVAPAGSVAALNNTGATVTNFRCAFTFFAG